MFKIIKYKNNFHHFKQCGYVDNLPGGALWESRYSFRLLNKVILQCSIQGIWQMWPTGKQTQHFALYCQCLCGTMVACWFLTQKITGSNALFLHKFCRFFWIHLGKTRMYTSTKYYRLGPVNSNTVNLKFHLIQTFFKICETFLYFQC